MLNRKDFDKRIQRLVKIYSVTGTASYSDFTLTDCVLNFVRDNTGKPENIDINQLYQAYIGESFINTVILRKYFKKRVFSPALAILLAIEVYDSNGLKK